MCDSGSSETRKIVNSLQQIVSIIPTITPDPAEIQAIGSSLQKVGKALEQYQKHTSEYAIEAIGMLHKINHSSVLSLYQTSNLDTIISIQKTMYPRIIESLRLLNQSHLDTVYELSKNDFRIGVASQELDQTLSDEPEEITEKLFFKETSNPTNELESQLFDILDQQRKILDDHSEILKEINHAQSENITDKQSNQNYESPAFYKNKMWYVEQIGAALIGLVVNEILNRTIGVDPDNTLLVALFLRCFLQFLNSPF